MVDWTKPIEAVRKSDGLVFPVTYASGPNSEGIVETVECPNNSETNDCWHVSGEDYCMNEMWFVRNVVDDREQFTPLASSIVINNAPTPETPTLRDQFAMAALTGLMAANRLLSEEATKRAYSLADLMMAERGRG